MPRPAANATSCRSRAHRARLLSRVMKTQPKAAGKAAHEAVEYALLDMADYAAALSKLGPAARITDEAAHIRHQADWVLKAGVTKSTKALVESSLELFNGAVATLANPNASEEARRQAIDVAISGDVYDRQDSGRGRAGALGSKGYEARTGGAGAEGTGERR